MVVFDAVGADKLFNFQTRWSWNDAPTLLTLLSSLMMRWFSIWNLLNFILNLMIAYLSMGCLRYSRILDNFFLAPYYLIFDTCSWNSLSKLIANRKSSLLSIHWLLHLFNNPIDDGLLNDLSFWFPCPFQIFLLLWVLLRLLLFIAYLRHYNLRICGLDGIELVP